VWACGWMLCQSGSAHGSGGVVRRMARDQVSGASGGV